MRPVTLDFTSSGQWMHATMQLFADDQRIANAVDLIDWTHDPVQVEICEHCGTIHCEPGGWVSFRRCGVNTLVIPAFEYILLDPAEHCPPDYLAQRGLMVLSETGYARIRSLVSEIPPFDALAPLTCKEAAQALQWQAPGGVLGASPAPPALPVSWVLAADPGEPQEQVKSLNALLAAFMAVESPAVARPVNTAVTLYLDLPGTPGWVAFTADEPPSLVLGPGIAASAA